MQERPRLSQESRRVGRGPSGGASSSGAPPRVKYTDRPWRQFTSERCARLELIQDPTEGRMRPVLDLDPAIVAAAAVAVLCLETMPSRPVRPAARDRDGSVRSCMKRRQFILTLGGGGSERINRQSGLGGSPDGRASGRPAVVQSRTEARLA